MIKKETIIEENIHSTGALSKANKTITIRFIGILIFKHTVKIN